MYCIDNMFGPECSYIDVIFNSTTTGFNFKGNIFNETSGTAEAHLAFNQATYPSGYNYHIWNNGKDVTPSLTNTVSTGGKIYE